MRKIPHFVITVTTFLLSHPALAGEVTITDAYFRTSSPIAKAGAAFMQITNHADADDRLIAITSDIAIRVEMHRNIDAGNGVMQMRRIDGGIVVPAGASHTLARGGDHLMFMGLTRPVADGDLITVVFTFEFVGEISVEIPVDQTR